MAQREGQSGPPVASGPDTLRRTVYLTKIVPFWSISLLPFVSFSWLKTWLMKNPIQPLVFWLFPHPGYYYRLLLPLLMSSYLQRRCLLNPREVCETIVSVSCGFLSKKEIIVYFWKGNQFIMGGTYSCKTGLFSIRLLMSYAHSSSGYSWSVHLNTVHCFIDIFVVPVIVALMRFSCHKNPTAGR